MVFVSDGWFWVDILGFLLDDGRNMFKSPRLGSPGFFLYVFLAKEVSVWFYYDERGAK